MPGSFEGFESYIADLFLMFVSSDGILLPHLIQERLVLN